MSTTCSISGCDQPAHSRGWCAVHYGRWYRNGDPEAATPRRTYKRRTSTPPTERHKKVRELVSAGHTNRQIAEMLGVNESTILRDRRHLGIKHSQISPRTETCTVPDCARDHHARGYCRHHHHRWRKYGDPLHIGFDPERTAARRAQVADLTKQGMSAVEISSHLNIPCQTVYSDRQALGISRPRKPASTESHVSPPQTPKTPTCCSRCGISFRRARPAAPHPSWCWDCWDVDQEVIAS